MITRMRVRNFKSLADLELELGPLTAIAGPNAAGKSNILDALSFLRDCIVDTVEAAVWHRGRFADVVHRGPAEGCGNDSPIQIEVEIEPAPEGKRWFGPVDPEGTKAECDRALYELEILGPRRPTIERETLRARGRIQPPGKRWEEAEWQWFNVFERTQEEVTIVGSPLTWFIDEGHDRKMRVYDANKATPFVNTGFCSWVNDKVCQLMRNCAFHDIQPAQARAGTDDWNASRLEPAGDNLAAMLRVRGETRQRLLRFMRTSVDGFEDMHTTRSRSGVQFYVEEKSVDLDLFPASISDGTVRLLAYLVATLGARESGLVALEEPERSLHPHLIQDLIGLFREVSKKTQVIITTHSPVTVNWLEPEELILVRKRKGATSAFPATDIAEVRHFAEQFGLGEAWVQGRLERGEK